MEPRNPKISIKFWYQDRIHLKPTHYAYAQYLEALEDVEGALTHYEYLGFPNNAGCFLVNWKVLTIQGGLGDVFLNSMMVRSPTQ